MNKPNKDREPKWTPVIKRVETHEGKRGGRPYTSEYTVIVSVDLEYAAKMEKTCPSCGKIISEVVKSGA